MAALYLFTVYLGLVASLRSVISSFKCSDTNHSNTTPALFFFQDQESTSLYFTAPAFPFSPLILCCILADFSRSSSQFTILFLYIIFALISPMRLFVILFILESFAFKLGLKILDSSQLLPHFLFLVCILFLQIFHTLCIFSFPDSFGL